MPQRRPWHGPPAHHGPPNPGCASAASAVSRAAPSRRSKPSYPPTRCAGANAARTLPPKAANHHYPPPPPPQPPLDRPPAPGAPPHLDKKVVGVARGGVPAPLSRRAPRQDIQAPRTWQLSNAAINRLLWTPDGLNLIGWADTRHLD